MWSRVQALIEEGKAQPISWRDRFEEWVFSPVVRWGFASLLAIGVGLTFLWPRPGESLKMSKFGEIWKVYTYQKDVSVTAYDSKAGDATVVWVSDLQEHHFSDYGEIWKVYTYKPEVYATAYQSEKADATIIWVSGVDDEVISQ
jgi:hypothetical protein